MSADRLIERARQILIQERALMVEGRWSAMFEAAERREAALAKLSGLDVEALRPHGSALDGLREIAARNAALLAAAREGFALGRRRAAEAEAAGGPLTTYDRQGGTASCGLAATTGRRV